MSPGYFIDGNKRSIGYPEKIAGCYFKQTRAIQDASQYM